MQANQSRDTRPELAVRRILHASGLRYRVHIRPLPELRRSADVVFTRARIAVFIDGCFWHGCPTHFRVPASNVAYWELKISTNRKRDVETTHFLEDGGWTVLRFWEHEDPATVAGAISTAVRAK